jgi:hypothetical protein
LKLVPRSSMEVLEITFPVNEDIPVHQILVNCSCTSLHVNVILRDTIIAISSSRLLVLQLTIV